MPTSVLLVEDDPATRDQLRDAVAMNPGLTVTGAVGTVSEGRELLRQGGIAVLLTDLGLPDGSGVELVREAARGGDVLPLVITVFGDERHVVDAIRAGAMGYLLKDHPPEELGAAILDLLDGGAPISPGIARYLLSHMRNEAAVVPSDDVPALSDRECEVLRFIVKGFTYAEIASMIDISTHTVSTHIRKIYRKLSVHSRGEAVYEAWKMGLVEADD